MIQKNPITENKNVCEVYGQTAVRHSTSGQWIVEARQEPTEWPGFVTAFNAQLRPDWTDRSVNIVSAICVGDIPFEIRGRCGEYCWKADRVDIQTRGGETVGEWALEVVP